MGSVNLPARERCLPLEEMQRFLAGLEMQTAHPPLDDAPHGSTRHRNPDDAVGGHRLEHGTPEETQDEERHHALFAAPTSSGRCAQDPVSAVGGGLLWERGSGERFESVASHMTTMEFKPPRFPAHLCELSLSGQRKHVHNPERPSNHRSSVQTSTYTHLNIGAVDRALPAQAYRLCTMVHGPVVLPTSVL